MFSVLFVCTANICRSPMAEGILKSQVRDEIGLWRIESAGVWALAGQPAALNTRQVLQKRGIILPDFQSRPIAKSMITEFSLILVMERGHREALRAAFPEYGKKIHLLRELIGKTGDVVDPIGGPIEDYEDTAQEIERILKNGYEQLRRLAANSPANRPG